MQRSLREYDKSQNYCEQLLNQPDEKDLASIEQNIERALNLKYKCQRKEARKYYDRMINTELARMKDSAYVLHKDNGTIEKFQIMNNIC